MDAGHYVRHASRTLRARPVLTLVCVSIVALGSRALGAILYGVAPHDGLTYACAAALVAIVSTLAAWAPAARAANVDPASLLR
jgi:hypothetical protein